MPDGVKQSWLLGSTYVPPSMRSPNEKKDIKSAPWDLLALTKIMDRELIGNLKADHFEFGATAARRY